MMTLLCPQEEVSKAWRINPSEPIVIRLHFSLSQYLDGPGERQQRCCKPNAPSGHNIRTPDTGTAVIILLQGSYVESWHSCGYHLAQTICLNSIAD